MSLIDSASILKLMSKTPFDTTSVEEEIKALQNEITKISGVQEIPTGLAPLQHWDLEDDLRIIEGRQFTALQVARISKILPGETFRACISIRHSTNFLVGKNEKLSEDNLEEDMRVGLGAKLEVKVPLPPSLDPTVSLMQVDDRPTTTYADVGGCSQQLDLIREIIELPILHPEKFEKLGIQPPRSCILYGVPGVGKTLTARAIANKTRSTFIRVTGSELNQKYVGEGARMVREIFQLARSKKHAILFFDEADSFCQKRSINAQETGDTGVQRTMLELINQLDGFRKRGNVFVLMASNRPDTLDEALQRPGRLDRKIEFKLPDLNGRAEIFKIQTKKMAVQQNIRWKLLARLCPDASGAEIASVCREAGMLCVRERRREIIESDFVRSIEKVIKGYRKFLNQGKYMAANVM
ncbi:26S protease regulatory subunit 7 [Spironucleus salmonicida]|uniref:26S protease regulatory subunit 7 n=1 Tax=Spironucleus salmonicida TaxID=348837 RepID=V6LF52_9EUKA|nr:26S protease regulatory subunit 7 [Spironucleus salmonicida]|eukprot:EST42311.1 26S protease regulatory subunit 7 [Spironucleus salmonicida]